MSDDRTFDEAVTAQSGIDDLAETSIPVADEAVLSDAIEDDEQVDVEEEDIFVEDADDEESGHAYMQNRELSWLTFNERVLDQGADESVPLLERLNFISIFWSNLQEFFMVRVGSLTDLSFIEPPVTDSKTGMTADEQIKAIHERCHELYPIQESTYEHVRGSLAKEGVRHLRPEDLSDEQRNYLFGLVRHNIEPFLSPQIINSRHPFPHLENGKLYILVRLDDEASEAERKKKKKKDKAKKDKGGAAGVVLGLIPLPHQCERVIKLPGRGFQFILLEHAIEMFVPEIFSMYKIKHTNVICVTRNADIDANQAGDEQDEDYREHMKRLLKQRARLAPVRLECERPLSPVMEKLMLKKLGLKRSQVYDTIVPLDLSFTWGLGSRLSDKKREKLSNPPFTPAWPPYFDRKLRIMDQIQGREVLLSYPYDSIDPFVQLLREAANDPDVISIKITLYRLASQSHIAEALIAAADAGKEVTALFELRARFDENNNIEWSQRFEQAGCNVLYGFRDYKVHSKICCITRRTPEGRIQHITQLGTGNYNEKTARLYTDFAFITTDEAFARDALEFFRNMQLENVSDNYAILRVAPLQIKTMILENLDKQIARAKAGLPATAFMKANSITDKDVIEKISEASCAGVKVTLFIRGICCLVPRVKGATDNVRVVSIVGRLLEHSRIYCFGPANDCTIYLSSADLMTRNLNKRVEIAWPLLDAGIRNQVLTYIDTCMRDTAKLRELRPNATYTPLGAFCDLDEEGNPEPAFDAQATLIARAAEAAGITSVEPKPQAFVQPVEVAPEPADDLPKIDEEADKGDVSPVMGFVPEIEPTTEPDEIEDVEDLTELTIGDILDAPEAEGAELAGIGGFGDRIPVIEIPSTEEPAPEIAAGEADPTSPTIEPEPEPESAIDLGQIPEPEPALAETEVAEPAFEPEAAPEIVPESGDVQVEMDRLEPASELDFLYNLELEPEPETEAAEASSTSKEADSSSNSTSDRVASLIAQLSSTPSLSVPVADTSFAPEPETKNEENLTEMSIEDILGPEGEDGAVPQPALETSLESSLEASLEGASLDSVPEPEVEPTPEPALEQALAAEPVPEPAPEPALEPTFEELPEFDNARTPVYVIGGSSDDVASSATDSVAEIGTELEPDAFPEIASEPVPDTILEPTPEAAIPAPQEAAQPITAEPTLAEPSPVEPAPVEPAPAEPAPAEPAPAKAEGEQPTDGESEEHHDFFEGSGREIEMPPEKKGLFSRFRKKS